MNTAMLLDGPALEMAASMTTLGAYLAS